MHRALAFDLDETLAESKCPVSDTMAALLAELLARMPVAVISGGKYEKLKENVADRLPLGANLQNLYLLPTCGASLYEHRGAWQPVYEEALSEDEIEAIEAGILKALTDTSLIDVDAPSHGERIERRGAQVTLSALGQEAPLHLKEAWDPERTKRPALRDAIARELPQFSVKTGGTTSFDITKPGIDKAFGVRQLSAHLSIPIDAILYIGDSLFPGGNDEVVKETGIETRATTSPHETERIITAFLA